MESEAKTEEGALCNSYPLVVRNAYISAKMLTTMDLDAVLRQIDDTIRDLPVLDPIRWAHEHRQLSEDREIVAACIPLRKVGLEIIRKQKEARDRASSKHHENNGAAT